MERWRTQAQRWRWLVAPLGAALFALRVSIERTPRQALWGAIIAVLCLAVGYLVRRARLSLEPLWLTWLYVAWPAASPTMALGVAFVALAALSVRYLAVHRYPTLTVDGVILLGALALYVTTLAPTILPADSGEFQIVGPLLGVAHPPGFALFTVLTKLFSLIPFGEIAWRVNLMGAVTGALTLVVVNRTARRLASSTWAGIAAASALAVSTTFWAQSTTINIRALTMFFTALSCDYLVRFLLAPAGAEESTLALTGLAVSYGLLIAHHAWPAFFAPVFAILILWHDPGLLKRFRVWPRYLLAFFAPFVSDLYIVARAITGAPFGTEELVDAGRIVDHLTGRGFGGDMFAFLRLDRVLWERFLVVGNILHFQFESALLIVAIVGFAWLVWKNRKAAFLVGGVFAVMAFIVATYRAPQSVEYLMPAYIPIVLCIGCAVALPLRQRQSSSDPPHAPSHNHSTLRQPPNHLTAQKAQVRRGAVANLPTSLLTATLLLPALFLGRSHLPSYLFLHRDRSAREYAESVLLSAPPDAHILSNWHWYTPLRYLQLVEGHRPDVQVTYLYPQGATPMPQAWPQWIRELTTSDQPLLVTNVYPTYADLPYRFVPHGEAFLVQAGPSTAMPTDITRADANLAEGQEHKIRILGYRLTHPEQVHPGDWITVDLIWQPLVPLEKGYSFSVQLISPDGIPMGQRDLRHDAAPSYAPREVLTDRYQFPVFVTARPGDYQLTAIAYRTQDGQRLTLPDGSDALKLPAIAVQPGALPPVTAHPQHLSFAGGPTLVGVDYDDTLPAQRRVYLHWRAGARPVRAQLWAGQQLLVQGLVPGTEDQGYITTALDIPPGTQRIRLALQQPDDDRPVLRQGMWGVRASASVPLPQPRDYEHYLPLGGKLALTGVRARDAWRAGETERVALEFLALRPIVLDYVISVGVKGDGVTDGPSDNVPAIGAMPTFKWIRGSRIADVHLISIRPNASGQGTLTLGVYDAFTAQGLPPLDERIAGLGLAGIPLKEITIPK
jgi:hypothetical protein